MTKCTICGEQVSWRSTDKHNKTRHPVFRRAYWRFFFTLSIPTSMFYLAFDVVIVRDMNNGTFNRNLVYLVGVVSPLLLLAWAYGLSKLRKLRKSLQAAYTPPETSYQAS